MTKDFGPKIMRCWVQLIMHLIQLHAHNFKDNGKQWSSVLVDHGEIDMWQGNRRHRFAINLDINVLNGELRMAFHVVRCVHMELAITMKPSM